VDIETTEDDTPAWVIPPRSISPSTQPRSPSPNNNTQVGISNIYFFYCIFKF
jgi:hypothetical protein